MQQGASSGSKPSISRLDKTSKSVNHRSDADLYRTLAIGNDTAEDGSMGFRMSNIKLLTSGTSTQSSRSSGAVNVRRVFDIEAANGAKLKVLMFVSIER